MERFEAQEILGEGEDKWLVYDHHEGRTVWLHGRLILSKSQAEKLAKLLNESW